SFVVSRDHFWSIGAYDEELCGIYGTDRDFRNRLFGNSTTTHLDHAPLIRVSREVIPDASTRDVMRKADPERRIAKKAVAARKRAEGREGKTLTLDFEWERIR